MNIEFEIPHGIAQDLSRIADSLDTIVAIMRGQHTRPIPVAVKALPDSESKTPENAPQADLPIADDPQTAPAKEAKPSKTGKTKPAEPQAEAQAEAQPEQPQKTVTAEDVRKALVDVSNQRGRDTVLAILARFSARKVSDILPEHYADVIAAVKEAA